VLLQVGENSVNNDLEMLEKVRSSLPENLQQRVKVVKWFGDEIGFIYTYADIVIARPGANTVLELLAREKKAVFVPIAWASGGEQQKNAEYFCANQEGQIVQQSVIDQRLLPAVELLLNKKAKPSTHLVKQNAVESIWKEIQASYSSSR
jgi:UDP-N-acetylglucosamine--N-acetylmuramyl-(pentapeptide) pyrophosphoryl-undecaprenol N-acetylglucosamine transferase